MNFLPVVFALALSIIHYLSELYAEHQEKHHTRILSFSAGAFITLLFLEMLPRAAPTVYGVSMLLLGFIVFHALERFVYRHYHPKEVKTKVNVLNTVGFFLTSFSSGAVIVLAFNDESGLGYAVFAALIMHAMSSSMMLAHMIEKLKGIRSHRLMLSSAPFLGALAATLFSDRLLLSSYAFSAITGSLFYIVARDLLPRDEGNRMLYFVSGVVSMYVLLLLVGLAV